MKILWWSDIHVHRFRRFAEPDEHYITTRIRRTMMSMEWVHELASLTLPDLIVFGGDFVHNPKSVDFVLYSMVSEIVMQMTEIAPVVMLRGNHDEVGEFRESSAIRPLALLQSPRLRVIHEPTYSTFGSTKIGFMPYSKRIPQHEHCDLIFCHHDILENKINGHALGKDSVDQWDAPFTISGHYHKPSEFVSTGRVFIYGGALLPHSFVDEGPHPYGALVIQKDQISWTAKKIRNPNAWHFLDVTVGDGDEWQEQILNQSYVRLYVPYGRIAEIVLQAKSLQRDRQFHYEITPLSKQQTSEFRTMGKVDLVTNADLIRGYVQRHRPKHLDPDELVRLGIEMDSATPNFEHIFR